MEGGSFEINVLVDERITCQLFAKEEHWNLPLSEVKGVLLEDVLEFIPVNYCFLKPISGSSKIPLAAKQEKHVTLQKCLVESKEGFSLHLQSYDDKPNGNGDGSSCSNERTAIRNETKRPNREFNEAVPRKITKQMTIESAFQIRKDRPVDQLDAARGRVHLYSSRDIERASEGRKEYYTFWNTKAQELRSNQNFNTYTKQELHGVIDTAWQMRSCDTLTAKVEAELQDVSGSRTKTVNKNLKRVREAKRVANELNLPIRKLKQQSKEKGGLAVKPAAEIAKNEDNLSDAISEVKLALDALRKSFKNAKKSKPQFAKSVNPEQEELAIEDVSVQGSADDEAEIGLDCQEVEELAEVAKETDDWNYM